MLTTGSSLGPLCSASRTRASSGCHFKRSGRFPSPLTWTGRAGVARSGRELPPMRPTWSASHVLVRGSRATPLPDFPRHRSPRAFSVVAGVLIRPSSLPVPSRPAAPARERRARLPRGRERRGECLVASLPRAMRRLRRPSGLSRGRRDGRDALVRAPPPRARRPRARPPRARRRARGPPPRRQRPRRGPRRIPPVPPTPPRPHRQRQEARPRAARPTRPSRVQRRPVAPVGRLRPPGRRHTPRRVPPRPRRGPRRPRRRRVLGRPREPHQRKRRKFLRRRAGRGDRRARLLDNRGVHRASRGPRRGFARTQRSSPASPPRRTQKTHRVRRRAPLRTHRRRRVRRRRDSSLRPQDANRRRRARSTLDAGGVEIRSTRGNADVRGGVGR